jgi:peptidyl-prolyl cis-trans isomerase D
MFDFVRTHQRWLQFILVLLVFPSFVFFGVQGYSQFGDESTKAVAKVDGQTITQSELEAAHQRTIDNLRQSMPNVDVKLLDTPAMRKETLDALIRERVQQTAARQDHLFPADERLGRLFKTDPSYAGLRNEDGSIKRELLAAQGLTSEGFAQRLRADYGSRQVLVAPAGTAFVPTNVAKISLDALNQQREIQVRTFFAKDVERDIQPSASSIQDYYQANRERFKTTESADIEYVVLDLNAVSKQVTVSEDDLRKFYAENEARYTSSQERRASHILIQADKSAAEDVRKKARDRAQSLLAEVRKSPGSFADLAKKNSQDPGSASSGGDLGFFGRGAMVKPFEDAAFAMKTGEISEVVESDFGFHILQLTGVRGGERKPFEQVRQEIDQELRKKLAQSRFAELAEQFTNLVYEQSENLDAVVDKLKLTRQQARVERQPLPSAAGPLASVKFLSALFTEDSVRQRRNTEAVDLGGSVLVSGRILQHAPSVIPELDAIRDRVTQAVIAAQAMEKVEQQGQALIAKLKGSANTTLVGDGWSSVGAISRQARGGWSGEVIEAALKAAPAGLPALVGVKLPQERGYAVVRVVKVLNPVQDEVRDRTLTPRLSQAWAQAEAQAHLAMLKQRFKVELTDRAPAAADAAK